METITFSQKGQELLDSLKRQLVEREQQAEDRSNRILNCEVEDTDCFRSIHANFVGQEVLKAKIRILEDGGCSDFLALADLDGNLIEAKYITGKYGMCWLLANGSFVGGSEKNLAKKGYKEVYVSKPAWVTYGEHGAVIFPIEVNKATE